MKFSIIVPVHNAENTIKRCVESLIEQNEEAQIILVENGSIDNTLRICEEIERAYSNVELCVNETSGVSVARNKGLLKVKGDIIAFCDADDKYETNILSSIRSIFDHNKVDIVISGFTTVDNDKQIKYSTHKESIVSKSKAIDLITCDPNIMGSVCNKFYKKELMEYMKFPEDLSYMEDEFFNVKLLSMVKDIKVYVSGINTYYYINNIKSATHDISGSFDNEGTLQYNRSLHKMLNELQLDHKEIKSVRDKIYRLSTPWFGHQEIKDKVQWKNKLYEEIKENWWVFAQRLFRYDVINRMKLLRRGLLYIIKWRG